MAMQDYFYTCHKLETKTVADGLGGYETVEYIGIEFMGLAVRRGVTEQLVGALRGNEEIQYTFHAPANVPLERTTRCHTKSLELRSIYGSRQVRM